MGVRPRPAAHSLPNRTPTRGEADAAMSPIFARLRQVRRGLAGLLFFVAAIMLALAAGGWWMQRVAFSPSTSRAVAREVFTDPQLRTQVAAVVAPAAAGAVGKPANQLNLEIAANTGYPEAAEFLADIVADIHARVIGAGGPVQITGPQMVNIVRDQNVAEVPAVTLPVEQVGILDTMRTVLRWFVPIAAVLGLAAVVLGVLAHPERADAIFGIGVLCILAGVLAMILGYVVPTFLVPLLTDNVWIEVIPAVANEELRTVAALSCALAIIGVVLILGSAGFRRRKTSWSSPVRVARYNEQRRWS
jgi:hypothetical protein